MELGLTTVGDCIDVGTLKELDEVAVEEAYVHDTRSVDDDQGASTWTNDAAAVSSNTGFGWFLPGKGLSIAAAGEAELKVEFSFGAFWFLPGSCSATVSGFGCALALVLFDLDGHVDELRVWLDVDCIVTVGAEAARVEFAFRVGIDAVWATSSLDVTTEFGLFVGGVAVDCVAFQFERPLSSILRVVFSFLLSFPNLLLETGVVAPLDITEYVPLS
jgi:hypothetical protein